MELKIISPYSKKSINIAWLELNTPIGNFVIKPGHAPTILALSPGKTITFCLSSGKQETYIIKRAVAEVTRTSITITINEEL